MSEYAIVTTLCDKQEIADKIVNTILDQKLAAGSQVTKVHSKYWWNNELEECDEFKIQFRTKKDLFKEIEAEIKKIHDYDVAEISCIEFEDASKEFINWIDENIKNNN